MSFCTYCGAQIAPGARFCPGCGAPVAAEAAVSPVVDPVGAAGPADYSIVLSSVGTCPRSQADDVLEDLLGYSNAEAQQLVRMIPTQIAQYLTAQQAQYLAQALTEYGMQVAVFCGQNAVDFGQYATSSVFNSDGSFVGGALAALATITVANRLTSFERWSRPNLLDMLFAPRYRPPRPPRHIRRPTFRPAPGPGPRPAPGPRPGPAPRSAPRPAPGPRSAPRPAPGPGPRGGIGGTGGSRGPGGPGGGSRGPSGGSRGPSGGGRGPSGGGRGPGGPGGRR